jgi:UDP-2,3-diacylglucosamine pyrophosphatase LpxH
MLIAVSDLHMSAGALDDFENDDHLVELIDNAGDVFSRKEKKGEKKNSFALNGDILDIIETPGIDFEAKLKQTYNKHKRVFNALNTLGKKFEVVYIRGNHDWDVFKKGNIGSVQKLIPNVKILNKNTDSSKLLGKYIKTKGQYVLKYDDPGRIGKKITVHIEHGNQYDEFNNFFHNDPNHPETSLGTLIVEEITNMLEVFFPNIDAVEFDDLLEELKIALKKITDDFELDGMKPNVKKSGLFSRISRAVRKIFDGIDAELTEQKREAKLHLARTLIDILLSASDEYVNQAKKIAEKRGRSIIVFGHTHTEKVKRINPDSLYVNSGTWTKRIRRSESNGLVETNPRAYVVINFNRTMDQNEEDAVRHYNGII